MVQSWCSCSTVGLPPLLDPDLDCHFGSRSSFCSFLNPPSTPWLFFLGILIYLVGSDWSFLWDRIFKLEIPQPDQRSMHLRSIDVKMIHPLLTHVSFGMEKVSSEQQLKGNVHYPVKGRRIGYDISWNNTWHTTTMMISWHLISLRICLWYEYVWDSVLHDWMLGFFCWQNLHSCKFLNGWICFHYWIWFVGQQTCSHSLQFRLVESPRCPCSHVTGAPPDEGGSCKAQVQLQGGSFDWYFV